MRVFLAFDVNKGIREKAEDIIKILKRAGGSVRWVKPENMHFTIKFFGEISSEDVENIDSVLSKHVKSFKSFTIKISGIDTFPSLPKNPRVVWAGIENFEELKNIHETLIDDFQKIGFPEEHRDFKPHLTIGRVKNTNGISGLKKAIEKNREHYFGEIEVKELVLYKSELTPNGPIYSALKKYILEK